MKCFFATAGRSIAILLTLVCVAQAEAKESLYREAVKSTAWLIAGSRAGSAVVIDAPRKLLVTSFHVVQLEAQVQVCFPQLSAGALVVERSAYREKFAKIAVRGKVLSRDPRRDLALVEVESLPQGVVAMPMAKRMPEPGDKIHSIGNPGASDALWVFTSGVLRQGYVGRLQNEAGYPVEAKLLEVQSPVNRGDSGGPALNEEGELVGIVTACRAGANLMSYFVHVSEVQELLGGKIKTIDLRVRAALDSAGWKYRIGPFGHFYLSFRQQKQGKDVSLVIRSDTERFRGLEIRELIAQVAVTTRPLDQELANQLLLANCQLKLGAWHLRKSEAKYCLEYCARIDAGIPPAALCDAVRAAVLTAENPPAATASLAAPTSLSQRALIGQWESRTTSEKGAVCFAIRVSDGGTLVWEDQSAMIRCRYELVNEDIVVLLNGERSRLGSVELLGTDELVLRRSGQRITFRRTKSEPRVCPPEPGKSS